MYQNPFGSLFGEEPAPMSPVPETSIPMPTTAEGREELLEARKAVANEIILPPKVPFSNEEPQFRAASTIVSDDPEVLLSQSKLSVQKSQIKYAALLSALADLDNKTEAAKIYLAVLLELQSLPSQKQAEIDDFIATNEKKIKALAAAQKSSTAASQIKQANAALDVEIKHWEELLAKKGKVTLKSFRPKGRKTSEELPITKVIPKIKGTVPMDMIARMGKNGVVTAPGYGDTDPPVDQVISSKPKKKEYYLKFKDALPDQSFFSKQPMKLFNNERLEKKAEKNVLLANQYDWKSTDLEKRLVDGVKRLEQIQAAIAKKTAEFPNQKTVAGISAIVISSPAKFNGGMLLDNLRNTLTSSNLNGLGDDQVANSEKATREAVLTDLQQQTLMASTPSVPVKSKSILGLLLLVGLAIYMLRRK